MASPLNWYKETALVIREGLEKAGSPIPRVALVLGSGLGGLEEEMEQAAVYSYEDLPHMPQPSALGHAGTLTCGRLSGRETAVLSGRIHAYEGYTMEETAYAVRVLLLLGVRTLILTNAAGAVNPSFHPGELMLVTDHIKLTTDSPARGKLPAVFGPMFPDMSQVYALRLRELALRCAREEGIALREGCYFYMPGPQYETPAEIRAVRSLGGDAVGMSTVAEAIAGAQGGMEVAAISCLTNMAAGMVTEHTLGHEEVRQTAALAADSFRHLLRRFVGSL